MKSGADGIVPSVGNLIPHDCQQQIASARRQDWEAVDACAARQAEVAAVYQKGRTLAQSLAALKGLLYHRGLCSAAHLSTAVADDGGGTRGVAQRTGEIESAMSHKPILGLTMGDPAGIGPEICLRALREPAVLAECVPVLFGDAGVLRRLAESGLAG